MVFIPGVRRDDEVSSRYKAPTPSSSQDPRQFTPAPAAAPAPTPAPAAAPAPTPAPQAPVNPFVRPTSAIMGLDPAADARAAAARAAIEAARQQREQEAAVMLRDANAAQTAAKLSNRPQPFQSGTGRDAFVQATTKGRESFGKPSTALARQLASVEEQKNPYSDVLARSAAAWRDSLAKIEKEYGRDKKDDTSERKLTDEEFRNLTTKQRAAVLYNTELLRSVNADVKNNAFASYADSTQAPVSQTRAFVDSLGLNSSDLRGYANLDNAISDGVLLKLEDPRAVVDSADSVRWARGRRDAASDSARFLRTRHQSEKAISAVLKAVQAGKMSLNPQAKATGLEEGTPGGAVLRRAYSFMVDKNDKLDEELIAAGLEQMNAQAGTKVTLQDLWDFTNMQLEAVRYAKAGVKKGTEVPVPVYEEGITPMSVAEIRKRYGL